MKFREFRREDVDQASKLLADRHKKERVVFPSLRQEFEDEKNTKEVLLEQMEENYVKGICAYEEDRLLGFLLSNIETDGMAGRCAFVNYEGFAISETESPELYRLLYAEIAKIWVANGILDHYIVVPAGDQEVVDAWLHLSFAYQQVYGIASLSRKEIVVPDHLTVKQADGSDAEALRSISNLICSYQAGSPCYTATYPERSAKIKDGYGELAEDEDSIVLLAYQDHQLLGFQCANIEENDYSMMAPQKSYELSISGIIPNSRGMGIGSLLTGVMMNKAMDQGYKNVIADWRIANLSSSNFWPKQGFRPVAYRMFRSIDETIYWADGHKELN